MSDKREINLIPHDVLMRDKTRRRVWMWGVITLLVIISLSAVYAVEKKKISAVEGEIADLSLRKLQVEEKIKQLNILQKKRDRLAKKRKVINILLQKKSLSFLFFELENVMNKNVWLTSLDFRDDFSLKRSHGKDSDEWVETGYFIVKKDRPGDKEDLQNNTPRVSTVLQGMAKSNKDLANFLKKLTESEYFSEVDLKYSQQRIYEGLNAVEFKIETYRNIGKKI